MTNAIARNAIAALSMIAMIGTPAVAQQQSQSPMEQAMGAKLLAEISVGLQCSADAVSTRAALDKALARIKELEAKAEPDPR